MFTKADPQAYILLTILDLGSPTRFYLFRNYEGSFYKYNDDLNTSALAIAGTIQTPTRGYFNNFPGKSFTWLTGPQVTHLPMPVREAIEAKSITVSPTIDTLWFESAMGGGCSIRMDYVNINAENYQVDPQLRQLELVEVPFITQEAGWPDYY